MFDGYSYEYDKQNRISAIKQLDALGAETEMYSYEYDKLGQLVRYNDKVANKSYTYTYDGNGNILTKSEYAYTTGDLGTATNTTTYGYDTQWKDKLTTVGDKTITYDLIGNPISYLGANLTWEGRQLTSYSNDDYSLNYEYDENGMRYRTTVLQTSVDGETGDKTVEETNYEYVWSDGKLVSLVYFIDEAQCTAKYLYNEFDEPVGMIYTDESNSTTTLYYLKNAQGDITCIVDSAGEKYISFSYDALGKVTTQYHLKNNLSTPLGMVELILKQAVRRLAVFGYRGYCYDTFTGLYYLQSRYYDPNVGRFINADDTNYLNATGTILGCNLFAYCENDPVNRVDPKGTVPYKFFQLLLGGFLGLFVQYISDLIDVKFFKGSWSHWSDYVYSVAKEAWGAISDSGILKTLRVVIGMSAVSELIRCISKKVNFSVRNIFNKVIDAVIDFILSSVLKIKSPQFIRDIKAKARSLGIKGTKKLTQFLNKEIFKINMANISLSNLVSLIKEVVKKIFKNNSFKLVKY